MRTRGKKWSSSKKTNSKACLSLPLHEKLTLVKPREMENIRQGKMKNAKERERWRSNWRKRGTRLRCMLILAFSNGSATVSIFEPGALLISLKSSSLEASCPNADSYSLLSKGSPISSTSMGSSTVLENLN